MRSVLIASLVMVSIFLLASMVEGRIVDPCPTDELLERLAEPLEAVGIDVALGVSSKLEIERPRLARLEGYSPRARDWGTATTRFDWAGGFFEGLVGALMAVEEGAVPEIQSQLRKCTDEPTRMDQDACRFLKRWLNEDREKRIFVSYTKADWAAARAVKMAMEEAGYVVFTYLKDDQAETWADPGLVGVAFSQSGARYVIDSRHARGSLGVAFEEQCGGMGALIPVSDREGRLARGDW